MHPVTQTFRDATLERAYLDHSADSSRRAYRIVGVLIAVGAIGAYLADRSMFGSDANVEVMHRARQVVMFPVIALGIAFGYAPARWFRRWWREAVCVVVLAILVTPAIAVLLLPDPERLDNTAAYISVVAVMVAAGVMFSIGFLHVLVTTLVVLAALVRAIADWPGYSGDAASWLVMAAGVAMFAAYQTNLRDRLAFAAQYRLDEERARSDRLLRNVLPGPIADRLMAGEARIADRFEAATVLFADLVGFTTLAARLTPEALVAALDEVFSAFDDIAARHGLEKIKTIGDAYLVVGGVPTPREDHAVAVAHMALEMRALIAAQRFGAGHQLELRIGLHSGPLVAGVIGKQKFIYDLWGDTVNTASRMESSGVASAIQVTGDTEALLRGRFTLEPRGKIAVKGKGELDTWMLVA